MIAALELLGTIIAVKLFAGKWARNAVGTCGITGSTGNRGNSYAVTKMMSTKWPVTALIIELSEELRANCLELHLAWLPRDLNEEADARSNLETSGFDPSLEIKIDTSRLGWRVLDELMPASSAMFERMLKDRAPRLAPAQPARCKGGDQEAEVPPGPMVGPLPLRPPSAFGVGY